MVANEPNWKIWRLNEQYWTMTTRFTLNLPKPRNPLLVPSRSRLAGAHRQSAGALRQAQRRDIARELAHERHHSP
jgi:hypothetical protein